MLYLRAVIRGVAGATLPEQGWDWERVRPAGWEGSEALMFELRGVGSCEQARAARDRNSEFQRFP